MVEQINRMPVKTWNWLKMNEASIEVPDEVDSRDDIVIHADGTGEKTSELPFVFEDQAKTGGKIEISVDSNINHIVLEDFKSNNGGFADVSTKINLASHAKLTLVQVHRLGDEFTFINRIEADVADHAEFRLMQVFISGKGTYAGVNANLAGRRSAFHIDTGYLTNQDHVLDINYNAMHSGEKSMSDISVNGAMCDRSVKRFRGTIDFRQGAIGAKGNEIENVLLLDDEVENHTIPIILCVEEDVEGNHGASIGRMDDDMLYYMKSRGLDEEYIREMMKTACIDAVLSRLPAELSEFAEKIRMEEATWNR
ncbi:MAG: SufD family Fe-S cluster assembly protein [Eubacterium sp.]|nr:SufD family Fe-S cluster assembly protein [Eubacterium sp.]